MKPAALAYFESLEPDSPAYKKTVLITLMTMVSDFYGGETSDEELYQYIQGVKETQDIDKALECYWDLWNECKAKV